MTGFALGLIETKGLVGAIEACDAAAKSAQVTITSAEVIDGGLVTLKIEGDLAAVRAAVDAGARAAERIGELITAHVIPRPDDDGLSILRAPGRMVSDYHQDDGRPPLSHTGAPSAAPPPPPKPASLAKQIPKPALPKPKPTAPPAPPPRPVPIVPEKRVTTLAELEKMSVPKLRQFARTVENLPLQGRQISMANKTQLIEALKSVMNLE